MNSGFFGSKTLVDFTLSWPLPSQLWDVVERCSRLQSTINKWNRWFRGRLHEAESSRIATKPFRKQFLPKYCWTVVTGKWQKIYKKQILGHFSICYQDITYSRKDFLQKGFTILIYRAVYMMKLNIVFQLRFPPFWFQSSLARIELCPGGGPGFGRGGGIEYHRFKVFWNVCSMCKRKRRYFWRIFVNSGKFFILQLLLVHRHYSVKVLINNWGVYIIGHSALHGHFNKIHTF